MLHDFDEKPLHQLPTSPPPVEIEERIGRAMSFRSIGMRFTDEDHAVWDLLFARQVDLLGSRVVSPFLHGIDLLRLSHPGVPDVDGAERDPRAAHRLAHRRGARAGARRRSSSRCLSERVFPVGNFIRTREQLDYLEAPDCFHDLFGHIPMLAHHDFAEMARAYRPSRHCAAIAAGQGTVPRGSIGTASNSGSRGSMAS